jgi:hypothetical protein
MTTTPDLFDSAAARAARDDGMQRAATHADDVVARWTDNALAFVKAYAQLHQHLTGEYVRFFAESQGLPAAPDNRAWGAVMIRAARAGLIEKDGWTTARDPKGHCHPIAQWRSKCPARA